MSNSQYRAALARPFPLRDKMVEPGNHIPRAALGTELRAVRIHAHTMQGLKIQRKQCISIREGKVHLPMLPQVRVLQQESQDAPVSEDSIPSSASPRSGLRRVHPCRPVEDAVEGSSFELVPSLATQAPCASSVDECLDATPIPRSNSSGPDQYRL